MSDENKSLEKPEVFSVVRPGGRRAFLGTLSRGAALGTTAMVGDSCKSGSPAAPTATTTTTTTSTTSTTTSSSTVAATFTLAGVVTANNGRALPNCYVVVVDGPNQGRGSMTDGNGYYSIPGLVGGSFTLRTTINNVFLRDQAVTISRDTRLDFGVTTTSTTTTSTTSSSTTSSPTTSTNTTCSCDLVHYWYPN
jgi:hypothetical protein